MNKIQELRKKLEEIEQQILETEKHLPAHSGQAHDPGCGDHDPGSALHLLQCGEAWRRGRLQHRSAVSGGRRFSGFRRGRDDPRSGPGTCAGAKSGPDTFGAWPGSDALPAGRQQRHRQSDAPETGAAAYPDDAAVRYSSRPPGIILDDGFQATDYANFSVGAGLPAKCLQYVRGQARSYRTWADRVSPNRCSAPPEISSPCPAAGCRAPGRNG